MSVKVNGKEIKINSHDNVDLLYNELPLKAEIEVTTAGGWPEEKPELDYPELPELVTSDSSEKSELLKLPGSLQKPFEIFLKMKDILEAEQGMEYDKAFVDAAIKSIEDYQERASVECGEGYYRPITPEREEDISKFYEQAALTMYKGFSNRMARYAERGNNQQKQLAILFNKIIN